jgi:hypothetical protein
VDKSFLFLTLFGNFVAQGMSTFKIQQELNTDNDSV